METYFVSYVEVSEKPFTSESILEDIVTIDEDEYENPYQMINLIKRELCYFKPDVMRIISMYKF